MALFIYKCRWDVEKAFDEQKNKLFETKNWAIIAAIVLLVRFRISARYFQE